MGLLQVSLVLVKPSPDTLLSPTFPAHEYNRGIDVMGSNQLLLIRLKVWLTGGNICPVL